MKIIHIVPCIGHESSGPSYSVPRLCLAEQKLQNDIELHTLTPAPSTFIFSPTTVYPRHQFPHPRLGYSPEMEKGLSNACQNADCIVNHGLWMYPNIYPERARRKANNRCFYIAMPRGTLSSWCLSKSRLNKAVSWFLLGQRKALFSADMLIATAESEYHDIRTFGLKQPVAIIPNGIDIPESVCPKSSTRTMVFLSRIHPTKGVDKLLKAWRAIQDSFPEWYLKIVGPITDYGEKMIQLSQSIGCQRTDFPGELRGKDKVECLSKADCFVLPTHSENFGMAVAESLSCGTPVITTKGAPWKGLVSNECGWWISPDESALTEALRNAMSLGQEKLIQMGQNGRHWMQKEYSWNRIAEKHLKAIMWFRNRNFDLDYIYTN